MNRDKRIIEDLELKLMRIEIERRHHYQNSIAFQKLTIILGCIIVLLIVYIVT